jgi:hypothetical protein
MLIQSITCKLIRNLGNYQSETLEATAIIGEDECVNEAIRNLRRLLRIKLSESLPEDKDLENIDQLDF